MRFCDNVNCETPDRGLELISDYCIAMDGAVLCIPCHQMEYEIDEEQEEVN